MTKINRNAGLAASGNAGGARLGHLCAVAHGAAIGQATRERAILPAVGSAAREVLCASRLEPVDKSFYLAGFDGEGQAAFSTNLQAEGGVAGIQSLTGLGTIARADPR